MSTSQFNFNEYDQKFSNINKEFDAFKDDKNTYLEDANYRKAINNLMEQPDDYVCPVLSNIGPIMCNYLRTINTKKYALIINIDGDN